MKSPKEDYEIRKSVVSDPGTGEDLLNFLSFYTLVFIMYLYLETIKVLLKSLDPLEVETDMESFEKSLEISCFGRLFHRMKLI